MAEIKYKGDWRTNPRKRILIDMGASELRISTALDTKPLIVLNAIGIQKKTGQVYIGNDLKKALNLGTDNLTITRPIIRGLLHDSTLLSLII